MDRNEIIAFGKWLKAAREDKGLTQTQLAARIGVSAGSIAAIEGGKVRSVGNKMEAKLRAFFEGGSPPPAPHALQGLGLTGLEALTPALQKLAAVSLAADFPERVAKVQDALGCTEAEAAAQIFLWELQKNKIIMKC